MGGDQAAAKTLFGRSSLDGGTADAPRFTAVVVASFAAGAGVGLLASGGPRGSTAATIAFATVVALAAVWSAVANAREAQASVGRDLVAAERARLGRELHSTLGHLAFIQAQAAQLRRLVAEHDEPLGDIVDAARDAAREARVALSRPATGAGR
ncbi:MAG TPA: histidine kinase [Acidimicrobiales bacterium]|nr:histidine kinase [Acidimicrobiales bacterium]